MNPAEALSQFDTMFVPESTLLQALVIFALVAVVVWWLWFALFLLIERGLFMVRRWRTPALKPSAPYAWILAAVLTAFSMLFLTEFTVQTFMPNFRESDDYKAYVQRIQTSCPVVLDGIAQGHITDIQGLRASKIVDICLLENVLIATKSPTSRISLVIKSSPRGGIFYSFVPKRSSTDPLDAS